jgi:hypothetical protein
MDWERSGTERRAEAWRNAALVVFVALAVALAPLWSCSGELSPQSLVERFRILAVRADVPEPSPGDTVTLDALVADPDGAGRAVSYLWVACVLGPSRDPQACADPSGGGIIGVGFAATFSFVAPALAGGETAAQVLLTFSGCAGGTFTLPMDGGTPSGTPECAGGDAATAYKRVVVSTATERNHNPSLATLSLDGESWVEGPAVTRTACVEGSTCTPLEVGATLGPGSAENWTEIVFGSPQVRTEEVFVSWFATGGSFERIRSGGEDPKVKFTPPKEPGTLDFWFVVHDGRGGTDWTSRQMVFE